MAVTDPDKRGRTDQVESVARACDILRAFQGPDEVLELRTIAERTRINKVTAFRILRTLERKGVLERVGRCGYRSLFHPIRSKRFRFGYAAQSTVTPFIGTVTESIRVAARSAEVDVVLLNNEANRTVALRNVERFIRERVDLVMDFQLFADIADNVAAKLAAAGIPLIAIDNPHPGSIYFGADNYKAGYIAGTYLGRWATAHWRGNVDEILLLSASIGGPALNARVLGIADGVAAALPHAMDKRLLRYDTRGDLDTTVEAIRKHVRRSSAERVLIGTVNDPSALGALMAFRDFGIEDRCAIVGQGAVVEAREEMRRPGSRLVGSVAYFPEDYGVRLMQLAKDVLNQRPVPRAVFTRHQMVTPANVDKVYSNDVLIGSAQSSVTVGPHDQPLA